MAVEALEEVAELEDNWIGLTMSSLGMMASGSSLISFGVWI